MENIDSHNHSDEETHDHPKKSFSPLLIVAALLLVVAVIALPKLMSTNSNDSSQITEGETEITNEMLNGDVKPPADTNPNTQIEGVSGEVKEFTIEGEGFKFTPNAIRVKKGDTVTVVFKNIEGMHDFVIDELNVKTAVIEGGSEETVTFVADKTGSFEFYCSVGSHRKMGMVGNLIVE